MMTSDRMQDEADQKLIAHLKKFTRHGRINWRQAEVPEEKVQELVTRGHLVHRRNGYFWADSIKGQQAPKSATSGSDLTKPPTVELEQAPKEATPEIGGETSAKSIRLCAVSGSEPVTLEIDRETANAMLAAGTFTLNEDNVLIGVFAIDFD